MKNPNGYGSVVKLSGSRRKPYAVRKTAGWDERGYPIYQTIGYFATRQEGLMALAEYNRNPYDINASGMTMEELFAKFSEERMPKLGKSLQNNLRSSYKHCKSISTMRYRDIRTYHMQQCIDNCGKGYGTQGSIKSLFYHLDRYAMEIDVIQKMYSTMTTTAQPPESSSRNAFTDDEIQALWRIQDQPWVDSVLVMIYSGWRINELLDLTPASVNTEDWTIIGGSKTKSGKGRIVPIHSRIQPLVQRRLEHEHSFLFSNNGKRMTPYSYYIQWYGIMDAIGFDHTPHECRHTFRSRLDSAGANKVCIDLMMGHRSKDVGERVYTHKTIEEMRAAVELVTR